ncbi:pyridoxal phosphate-dependent aminotransferase [Pyrococcus sp. NA2]|uniref:aspartate aminotransferase family protein n=1 Tax=Pyrococcus sp. (strain NA2) TaxID=342949 RepID=UPI000209AD2B|nr:aspartate aminotransferase family protein [Pyrococcus sp. NA2]AEC51583.1 pyridoxal phosphate-dependent aminotransferase [Pyrococcus sp. NA2]
MTKWDEIKKYTSKKVDENLKVVELDEKYLPRAIGFKYYPLVIERARGSRVWDKDGNEYIDFLTSAAVFNVGHAHPKVVEAIKEQVDKFLNYTIGYLYTEPPVKLAKLLTEITPGNFEKKVTFGFSGSDAVDSSIKASRAYTKKVHIISFRHSYHGMTYGALSVTGIVDENVKSVVQPMSNVHIVDYPDPYRNPWNIDGYENPSELANRALDEVEKKIKELNEDVAGIILEPIQGDAGVVIPPTEFMKGLKKLTEEYGIVFIDEEVQTGMGRTGKWWAIEHFDVVPDLLVSAKALGGGMPISAVVGRAEIMDSVPSPLFVFTHVGHAVNASAAIATINVIKEEKLVERARELGDYAIKRFRELQEEYPIIGDVRGRGLMIGVDIVKEGTKDPDRELAQKICWRAWEKGLIIITFGKHGNVLRIAPPLTISKEDLDRGIEIIEEAIKDAINGKVPDEVIKFLRAW